MPGLKFCQTTLTAAIGVQALLASAAIQAQDDQSSLLEEIVVTAQKREQNLNDIGVTVSAFSGDAIEKLGFEQPLDLAAHTPGLSTVNATSGGTPIFAIRGIGLDDFNANNSSGTGVYIDEVFAAYPALLTGQLMDVERVEVLKGPQGTLYGRNTTGGAINFVSRKPTEDFEAYITADYSRWDTVDLSAAVSGPLSDSVRGRVAAAYTKQGDGWQKDVDTGKDYGKVDRYAVRGLLEFDLSDTASALLNIHYSADNSTLLSPQNEFSEVGAEALSQSLFGFDVDPTQLDFAGIPVEGLVDTPSDPTRVRAAGLDLETDEEGVGLSLTMNVEFEHFTLTSITAWDQYDTKGVDNLDGVPGANFDMLRENRVEQLSQELRLTSTGDGRTSWVAGVGYSIDDIENKDGFDVTQTFIATSLLDTGLALGVNDYTQDTESYGVYLHTETELSSDWRLTAGLRYSNDSREFDGRSVDPTGLLGFAFGGFTGPIIPNSTLAQLDDTEDSDDLSFRLGLDYAVNNDVLLYASVATGYKGGIYYGTPGLLQPVWGYVDPESVTTYELGGKFTLLDGRMQLNGAVFQSDYEDRQSLLLVTAAPNVFVGTLGNVPESEISGAELELNWRVLDGLDVKLGAGYLDAEVTKAPDSVRGLPLFAPVPEGETLSQAPEWSYSALVSYSWSVGDNLAMRVQTDYAYSGEQTAALADPFAIYGPYRSLGARVSLEDQNGDWELSIWGKNLDDEESETYSITNFFLGRTVYRQQPVSYGVSLTYRM